MRIAQQDPELMKELKKKICDVCNKRMWWWQDTTMTCDEYGEVIPINHVRCVE